MTEYTFNITECKSILNANICLINITILDNSATISVNTVNYRIFQGIESYINKIYITLLNIDSLNGQATFNISECPQGYKIINGVCERYLITPIGNFTEGEIYIYGFIAVPVLITIFNAYHK